MKLICINNKVGWDHQDSSASHRILRLHITIGKAYEAFDAKSTGVGVYNDNNDLEWYRRDRFITIKEYRKIKLEKIYEKR